MSCWTSTKSEIPIHPNTANHGRVFKPRGQTRICLQQKGSCANLYVVHPVHALTCPASAMIPTECGKLEDRNSNKCEAGLDSRGKIPRVSLRHDHDMSPGPNYCFPRGEEKISGSTTSKKRLKHTIKCTNKKLADSLYCSMILKSKNAGQNTSCSECQAPTKTKNN